MALFIASLNSGSNGNCYYIGNDQEAILVDGGISCRETEQRMRRLGLSMGKVSAIFISHEHTDHIKGIPVLAKKYNLSVYSTPATLAYCNLDNRVYKIKNFLANVPVCIGNLHITAFPKYHDACEPYSFIIADREVRVGVFTDIGRPCQQLIGHFKQCHAAFLESNYDEDLLENGKYPYHLKKRIRGGSGHLSNSQALEVFKLHKPGCMSHLILSHLSQENNRPDLVYDLFSRHAGGINVVVASRYKETPVFTIRADGKSTLRKKVNLTHSSVQTSLF